MGASEYSDAATAPPTKKYRSRLVVVARPWATTDALEGAAGDMVVKEPSGFMTVVKAETFAANYEEVVDTAAVPTTAA